MVAGLFDRLTARPPALAAPRVRLAFGPPAGGGGGLSGIAALGAALLGGGAAAAPGLESRLISLRLDRGAAPAVDVAELVLLPEGGTAPPAPGDKGSVTLEDGTMTGRFEGSVEMAERRGDGTLRLTLCNGGRALADLRFERGFADQDPGQIIAAICAEASVPEAAGRAGARLPRWIADGRRTGLDHVAALAALAGRVAVFDDAGMLHLIDDTATGEPVATLSAGGNLIDFRAAARLPQTGTLVLDGAGAEGGGAAWAWLRKTPGPQRAEAGSGPPVRRAQAPALRDQQAVSAAAAARLRAAGRVGAARFLTPGLPALRPGVLVTVEGGASGAGMGAHLVLAVCHRFDRANGFVTETRAAPLGAAGAGALAGGLAGGLL